MANETDKQIDDLDRAASDGAIRVHVDGKVRAVGNPTGAGNDMPEVRRGVVASHNDHAEYLGSFVGKARSSEQQTG